MSAGVEISTLTLGRGSWIDQDLGGEVHVLDNESLLPSVGIGDAVDNLLAAAAARCPIFFF